MISDEPRAVCEFHDGVQHMKPADSRTPTDGCQASQVDVVGLVPERDCAVRRTQERHHIRQIVVVRLLNGCQSGLVAVQANLKTRIRDVALDHGVFGLLRRVDVRQAVSKFPVLPQEHGRASETLCQAIRSCDAQTQKPEHGDWNMSRHTTPHLWWCFQTGQSLRSWRATVKTRWPHPLGTHLPLWPGRGGASDSATSDNLAPVMSHVEPALKSRRSGVVVEQSAESRARATRAARRAVVLLGDQQAVPA